MNQETKEFRQAIAGQFIKVLEEQKLDWKKNWSAIGRPVNVVKDKPYRGLNSFRLALYSLEASQQGKVADNRWATFHQIKERGWFLKKGCHGVKIECWQAYDFESRKKISMDEFNKASKNPDRKVGMISRYYTVFNGQDIVGIPPLEKGVDKAVLSDNIIEKISKGMGIEVTNDGMGRAFYRPSDDTIHLPARESFFSSYDYNSTALHELSHATGAAHRLNRDMGHSFGSDKYAYEELVAEISSCFMGEHLEMAQTEEHIENHKAYVQSWVSGLQEKPEMLVKAIKDAGQAANLLEFHAGILTPEEYHKTQTESYEISAEVVQEPVEKAAESINKAVQKNPELFMEADVKIHGNVTPETLHQISKVHSAELRNLGYRATPELLKKMQELDRLTDRVNSVKDIHKAFTAHATSANPSADKLVQSIGKMMQAQELSRMADMIPLR